MYVCLQVSLVIRLTTISLIDYLHKSIQTNTCINELGLNNKHTCITQSYFVYRTKGYLPVDHNSLLKSIILRCVTAELVLDVVESPHNVSRTAAGSNDMFDVLYTLFVVPFIKLVRFF